MQKKYIKVLDHKELLRDPDSKGIINIDNASMNAYKEERVYRLKLRQVVNNYDRMQREIEELQNTVKILKIEIDNLLSRGN